MSYVFLLNGKYWDTIAISDDCPDQRLMICLEDGTMRDIVFKVLLYRRCKESLPRRIFVGDISEHHLQKVVWPEVTR